jgi:hypothetical protein
MSTLLTAQLLLNDLSIWFPKKYPEAIPSTSPTNNQIDASPTASHATASANKVQNTIAAGLADPVFFLWGMKSLCGCLCGSRFFDCGMISILNFEF